MKQVLQDLESGQVVVRDTADPTPAAGRLLVRVQASLLSAGTESAQVAKGRQSLWEKIRQKPELLRKGWDELRERGLAGVREKLASKYEGYTELGYSCAGVVVDNGQSPTVPVGTLVACAGAGIANHAEFVSIPWMLSAPAPAGVTSETAAYATVGAIAMQGVRQAHAQLGEYVVVIGLGLVGLLTTQLLRAAGCLVAGIDPAPAACRRALANGCDRAVSPDQALDAVMQLTGGIGADAVIICAATAESTPLILAGQLARSRGRVVMVGATGMTVPREEYYLKELSLSLSRSYGPGRYDRDYEEEGHDYPIDHVRFTEQRNLRAFLELAQKGAIEPTRLTTHRFPVTDAPAAYAILNDRSVERAGVVLEYRDGPHAPTRFSIALKSSVDAVPDRLGLGWIGAGAYAQSMLLPLLKKRSDVLLRTVMTRSGSHALHAAKRFGFEKACTDVNEILRDENIQVVFVTTRHDSHAALTCRALEAGKHVWVEKPLALTLAELQSVVAALRAHPTARCVVGFNRPFAPASRWLFERLPATTPRLLHYRVNAGHVPPDSWVHDPHAGGGRLRGEGCHFFDFLREAAGGTAVSVMTEPAGNAGSGLSPAADFISTVRFENGAVGQLLYSSQGAPGMRKEHFECFTGHACGAIDDYREAELFQGSRRAHFRGLGQDKGQAALLERFLSSLRNGSAPPMAVETIIESSLLTLAAQQSLEQRAPVLLADLRASLT
jgi:predicted dehydrogenase/threonine dehydrogenase-like Zn-dependent dehydrogenase